ncbi:FimV/HubP family polar landmark protein [Photobacterium rosenbergii]|uniref:FimV/HubP family polar landmark protein n=1 Tax=Photobacterium rosenbergii TaxID=294936 RepID=A0ABU3ZR15_9GAMM|nr:FimV/HubP family polar landmark protein [Photobacterium rosenbergii]MDV5172507.1 FimV/HubP family polar landmark protein [Photobacterium rosenbergii]
MSDLSTMIKRIFLPVIFSTAVISFSAQSNTIRITGPGQGVQPAATSLPADTAAQGPSSANTFRYGPTTNAETLWSIATRYRPSNQVSIYQVIGAIFRQNPQAFENSNIHGLIPGSMLAIPTEAQMRRESIDIVKHRLEADQGSPTRSQARTASTPSAPKPTPKVAEAPRAPAPKQQAPKQQPPKQQAPKPQAPTVVATPQEKPEPVVETVVKSAEQTPGTADSQLTAPEAPEALIPPKPTVLQAQLDASDEQMTKLLESNHLLRVRLAEMQHEVSALKQQLSDDEVLREQIKGFINQQRALQTQVVEPEPTLFDRMIANPLMLAALALIPGALIAGALAYFLFGRKREAEDDVKSLDAPQNQDEAAMVPPPPPVPTDDEDVPSLTLGDDDELDDLFGDDDSLFDDPESSLFGQDSPLESKQDDDSNGFDLGGNLGASSISVNSDDDAIGLEDMERALDEMDKKPEPNSDEELAAMWEQSLQADEDDEDSFDLSYDGDELDLDASLDPAAKDDQIVDQAMLDDLFSSATDDALEDQPLDTQDPQPEPMVDQDELDALFDSVGSDDNAARPETKQEAAEQAAVDQALADIDMMASPESDGDFASIFDEAVGSFDEEIESAVAQTPENSTALLDELLDDEDSLTSDIEVEEDSTALLDELLDEPETDGLLANNDIEIDENSTELLDELLADTDDDLDSVDPEAAVSVDDITIAENSTELLDDILEQHSPVDSSFEVTTEETAEAADDDLQLDSQVETAVIEQPAVEPEDPQPEIDEIEQLLASADVASLDSEGGNDNAEIEAIGQTVEQLLESLGDTQETILDEPAFDFAHDAESIQPSEPEQLDTELPASDSEVLEQSSVEEPEQHVEADDEFPIFDEETLLAEFEMEPEPETEPVQAQDDSAPLTLDDLPEFDEEAAFNDPDIEPQLEQEQALNDDDEQAMLDNIVRQLQQAAEAADKPLAQPETAVESVSESQAQEPESLEQEAQPANPYSLHGRPDIEFETLDPASLPEFSEDDALQASFDEQHELEQYEMEQGSKPQFSVSEQAAVSEPLETQSQQPISPEPTPTQQPVSAQASSSSPEVAVTEVSMPEVSKPEMPMTDEFVDSAGLDMDALLSDPELQADWEREQLVGHSEEITTDSSAEETLSEEEQEIWSTNNPEPELEGEDWGQQPEMNIEDVPAYDESQLLDDGDLLDEESAVSELLPETTANVESNDLDAKDLEINNLETNDLQPVMEEAASELLQEPEVEAPAGRQSSEASYISIDELMKDLDGESLDSELDETPLNLDVGLDEFPDVLADIGSLDIDSQGEFASKLDLAKAYLEMNDSEGARGLLEQVAQGGDAQLQQEAKSLLEKLRK